LTRWTGPAVDKLKVELEAAQEAIETVQASNVAFTPYSTLSSITVQAAIQELLDEGGGGGGGDARLDGGRADSTYTADQVLDGGGA